MFVDTREFEPSWRDVCTLATSIGQPSGGDSRTGPTPRRNGKGDTEGPAISRHKFRA